MSWLRLKGPEPCAEKVNRVERIENEVSSALRDLRRSLHVAEINRRFLYDATLADVHQSLKASAK